MTLRIQLSACLALSLLAPLAACGDEPASDKQLTALPRKETPPPAALPGAHDVSPGLPPRLTPEAERSEPGARGELLSWARAIELRQFDEAWRMMSDGDREKWSRNEFKALFSDLGQITVAAPDGTMEGAAGSTYYTAPVEITASDRTGRPVRVDGEVVLRRANDVPGATAAQRRWHISDVALEWTH